MSAPRTPDGWQRLGAAAPRDLVDTRLQLHHAAQLAASVGKTLLEPQPDDSHPNLGWEPALGVLAGHTVPGERPFRAALRPADFALLLLGADGPVGTPRRLGGETLASARTWLAAAIEVHTGRPLSAGLVSPGYDLPEHPVSAGAAFSPEVEASVELGRWFANAQGVLDALAGAEPQASEVRCWPHHFDLATLIAVERGAGGEPAKTVGVGLSPGDGSYADPYWYVSPWPYPAADHPLATLPAGRWHREGFTAAILTGSELVSGDPDGQRARLEAFLDAAVAASRRALEG